jgi:predicted phosphate transport protein (TIGR00153 family)
MPREERFFELFARHSRTVLAGAEELQSMLRGGESMGVHYDAVLAREEEADEITREVVLAVRRTFITPFDRGDIQALISAMDDSIDQMKKTAKSIALFKIPAFTPDMQSMSDSIVGCARLLDEAVPLLSSINTHSGRISSICEAIKEIEGTADDVHDNGVRALYESCLPGDAMRYLAGNEVFDHLEKVVDCFDDVANVINSIVVEHV